MNLFELFVKIGVDDQASDKISDLSSKLGNGLKTAAKDWRGGCWCCGGWNYGTNHGGSKQLR